MTTSQTSVTSEDLAFLWQINPLAQAQLQSIIKERLLIDAQKRISDLEAQLEKKLGKASKNGEVEAEALDETESKVAAK